MKDIYIKTIASKVGIKEWQVENCVQLFEEGNTIPFISRSETVTEIISEMSLSLLIFIKKQ